ncbi:MAG: hypothetical protein JSU92_04200 [Deltaproteobacteria bacterium]|nr:MAG: hypothetical protein JSU92_04200 [Deltaproteobacteria bacterium]
MKKILTLLIILGAAGVLTALETRNTGEPQDLTLIYSHNVLGQIADSG